VQLHCFSPCPGAARRPWSCHLLKSLIENANLVAKDARPQSEFPRPFVKSAISGRRRCCEGLPPGRWGRGICLQNRRRARARSESRCRLRLFGRWLLHRPKHARERTATGITGKHQIDTDTGFLNRRSHVRVMPGSPLKAQ
jgi:hypothetical protein